MKKIPNPLLLCLVALFASCATSIPVTMMKPALVDLRGVERISVLPFGYADEGRSGDYLQSALYRFAPGYFYRSAYEQNVAGALTNTMNAILLDSGAYAVISSAELARLTYQGGAYSSAVDAFLSGEITMLSTRNVDGHEDVKGSDGVVRPTYFLEREVTLELTYRFIRAADGVVIGQITHEGKAKDKKLGDNAWDLAATDLELARKIIDGLKAGIRKEIAPWQQTEYRRLEADKDKDLRMKEADGLVKDGDYAKALSIFESVYKESGKFAAGYNAAIMTEILGRLEDAIAKMDALARESGNPKASQELARMRQTLEDNELVRESM